MSSQLVPNPESQHALLKIIKALASMPAQMLFYGSALLAIAATDGVGLPATLGTLATTVGMNVLSNMLERVARGHDVPDDEIRRTVEDVIRTSGIEKLSTSNEFQRAIAHMFRQFDLVKYAVHKGEINIATLLTKQFANQTILLEELQSELTLMSGQIGTLATHEQSEEIKKIVHQIAQQNVFSQSHFPTELVDKKIENEIGTLRKSRFFVEVDRVSSSLAFANKLIDGEFSGGTGVIKSRALAWCARILSRTEELNKAEEYNKMAQSLGTSSEIEIVRAFICSAKGDKNKALNILAGIDSPSARSASLMVVAHHDGSQRAVDWIRTGRINPADLDPDGKYILLIHQFQLAQWEAARETLTVLTDEDLDEAPILYHITAMAHLLSTVPEEYRAVVFNQLPFDTARFPLADDAASVYSRREAHHYFVKASQVAHQLNCPNAATIDDEYALWLELRDPSGFEKGRERLQTNLRHSKSALRLVPFGIQFRIELDLDAVEREIERQIALHGGITYDTAIARFALAFTQKNAEDAANYVEQHIDELTRFLDKKFMLDFQIEMLLQAGLLEKANECLDILLKEGLSDIQESRIRSRIAEARGNDPLESRKEQFQKTDRLGDLASLVDELETKRDWAGVCEYGEILFERTRALRDAERLANALSQAQKYERIVEFLKTNWDFLGQSKNLQMLYCWSLYYEGALLEARSELMKRSDYRHNLNYRALEINLAIALGNWNFLLAIVANEYVEKDKRSTQELLSIAQLALHLGSSHAKELIFEAADKGNDNAGILAAAYFLASNAGWEDDAKVSNWLQEAAALSGDNGPIQKMTLKDVLARKPEWDRRESETWQLLGSGEIPMFLAAHSLNKSLIYLMLFPALANLLENDPRRRGLIPAYSGERQPKPLDTRGVVGIDATALLTLSFLNLLDKGLDAFDTVYVPHSTLTWLFEEKQKAAFHQPSQIKKAHQILHLLATSVLEKLMPSSVPNSDLSTQVGDELALLIAEAEKVRDEDTPQRIVVRSSPVHHLGSLMEEEADLTAHADVLSSCQAIVDKLQEKGYITAKEGKKSSAYLQFQEKSWPTQPEIADGAILYLDDLTVTYFLHIGILAKLQTAGYRPIISPRKISESNELISYESISGKVNEAIERIRSAIHSRIESGKIRVGRISNIGEPEKQSLLEHPTVGVIALASDCDAIIADDRCLNQHANVDDGVTQSPIFTTLDLLDALVSIDSITPEDRLEYRTRLRHAGYAFVPVSDEELVGHLNTSIVKNNQVIETAELKAIRENILRIRMSTWLQLPKEAPWLDIYIKVFIRVLRELWRTNSDLSIVRARSEWILNQVDVRGWAHALGGENGDNFIKTGRTTYILMLLAPLIDTPQEIKDEYWSWVESKILSPIKEQYPDLYSWIVSWYRSEIAKMADMDLDEGEQLDK